MRPTTRDIIRAALSADDTVPAGERARILASLDGPPEQAQAAAMEPVVGFDEALRITGLAGNTLRLLARQGRIERVRGSGRRAVGYTRRSIRALVGADARRADDFSGAPVAPRPVSVPGPTPPEIVGAPAVPAGEA